MKSVPNKVGMLVSFDYQYAYHSLPLLYEHADHITLAVDQSLRTWTGTPFIIEDAFWAWLKELDTQNKIEIYKDDFFRPELDPMEQETRARNMLAKHMGEGGWHVQVDCDEYFPDFGAFAQFLKRHARWTAPKHPPIDIGAFWIPMFRQINDGFLYVRNTYESFLLATNRPDYQRGRASHHPVRFTPFYVFHQTWARPEEEMWAKLQNWSHSADFDVQSYFIFWKSVDRHNYRHIRDFHPLIPEVWHSLAWCPGKDISDFIRTYCLDNALTVPLRPYLRRRLGQLKQSILGRQSNS